MTLLNAGHSTADLARVAATGDVRRTRELTSNASTTAADVDPLIQQERWEVPIQPGTKNKETQSDPHAAQMLAHVTKSALPIEPTPAPLRLLLHSFRKVDSSAAVRVVLSPAGHGMIAAGEGVADGAQVLLVSAARCR